MIGGANLINSVQELSFVVSYDRSSVRCYVALRTTHATHSITAENKCMNVSMPSKTFNFDIIGTTSQTCVVCTIRLKRPISEQNQHSHLNHCKYETGGDPVAAVE